MVSVITITYNRRELLRTAIDSVLNQSYGHFEYIIIDDGSTDNTQDLVAAYQDPRIQYYYIHNTGYLSVARNHGLEKAVGKIVAFLDSDDFWDGNYLSEVVSAYELHRVKSVITNAVVFDHRGERSLMSSGVLKGTKGKLLEQHLLNDDLVIYPSCFSFLRNGHERLDTSMRHGENDLILSMLAAGDALILMKELVHIKKHESNISGERSYGSVFIQGYNEEFATLDRFLKDKIIPASLYKRAYSRYLVKQADNLLSIGMKGKAWRGYLRAFLKRPENIEAFLRLISVHRFLNRNS